MKTFAFYSAIVLVLALIAALVWVSVASNNQITALKNQVLQLGGSLNQTQQQLTTTGQQLDSTGQLEV